MQNNKGGRQEMENKSLVTAVLAGFSGVMGKMIGLNYNLFAILIIVMLSDIIIGVLFSLIEGEFQTKAMKKGVIVKLAMLILLLVLVLFQFTLTHYGIVAPFSNIMTGVFIFMEVSSILETFAVHNVILPKFITKWFKKAKESLDDENFNLPKN